MAIYHCSVKIIGNGRSIIAAAAYRASDVLVSEKTGIEADYTNKQWTVYTDIMLPENAPVEYAVRNTLWNAVEEAERRRDAQYAREIEVAIPREITDLGEQIELVREYVQKNFIDEGMIADIAIHNPPDKDGHNRPVDSDGRVTYSQENMVFRHPHAHILLTMRPVTKDGFGAKTVTRFIVDVDGNRVPQLNADGTQKIRVRGEHIEKLWQRERIDTVDWNNKEKIEQWREAWAGVCNMRLEKMDVELIDHRSYERQGIDREATHHLGVEAAHLEKRGIATELGDLNREIYARNEMRNEIDQTIKEAIESADKGIERSSVAEIESVFQEIKNFVYSIGNSFHDKVEELKNNIFSKIVKGDEIYGDGTDRGIDTIEKRQSEEMPDDRVTAERIRDIDREINSDRVGIADSEEEISNIEYRVFETDREWGTVSECDTIIERGEREECEDEFDFVESGSKEF